MGQTIELLLIDDDAVDRMAICRALARTNLAVQVTEVTSAEQAIAHLNSHRYDCVFLDYRLPERDGLSLIRQLRADGVSIPLVVLTGQGDEQTAVDLMKAGASDYLIKTRVSPDRLALLLHNALRVYEAEQREAKALTQLQQTNALLTQQNEELEGQRRYIEDQNLKLLEAYRVKSEFLATMSHELRTPLNVILGFSQILDSQSKGPLTTHQAEMVKRIFTNGKNLLNLVNDILDLSKLEAQRLTLSPAPVDLHRLVGATLSDLRSLADGKALSLESDLELKHPVVVSDEHRLRQVLTNLVSNAVKFTDRGRVHVTLTEAASDQIVLTVADTGIGIAAEQLPHIFEAFRQADQTIRRQRSGTGLGLAIVQSLVTIMGGTIVIDSQVGQGTTIVVTLPRQLALPPTA
ncbi:response regulator [Nodosilinea sp. LEGE 07088]|uniref:hybrid sensor histidine kinase/response regulator n=1 Tax=Nodosilinea sp. LEGE 07088 TaxID=2777968 RepID=UPI00187E10EC|nr:hybrid sensor histidine kinase/response regulator [Nodosilinea sp. LEGE 07088]MBE9140699.1 response regulator [Nodosilinea sp. LEGE 07088]